MRRLLLALPALALSAGLAAATPPQQGLAVSFTVIVGPFHTAEQAHRIGGGICLGSRRVTDPKPYFGVQWSPDGRRFAFFRHTRLPPSGMALADVFVADADGSNERNLTRGTGQYNWSPSWAPDGSRIVYGAGGDMVDELVTMRPDGSDKRPLASTASDDQNAYVAEPSWSPDGSSIVYTRSFSLWVVRPDGSDNRLVVRGGYGADWSADSRKLVFTKESDLALANADGSGLTFVTRTLDLIEGGADWSPDGTRIVYVSIDQRDPKIYEDIEDRMYLADADGGRKRILRGPFGAWSPTWRSASERVAHERPCVVMGTRRGDVLRGTARGDLISGLHGNDVIRAGGGNDVVFGDAGSDSIFAGPGNDVIGAQDNRRDLVDGGPGRDQARYDRRRDRVRSVERRLP
jgi:Tol biopolymer transport system component